MSEDKPHNHQADLKIMNMISKGGHARLNAINAIYTNLELSKKIKNHVVRKGGDAAEAQDVFHDGIIALDRNIREQKFKGQTSIEGYLFSICRNVWNNRWRQRSKMSNNEIQDYQLKTSQSSDDNIIQEQRKEHLSTVLQLIDEKCQKILTLWKASYSMEEIAITCNLSSAQLAKKYRFRCMNKLMKKLADRPNLIQALRNV